MEVHSLGGLLELSEVPLAWVTASGEWECEISQEIVELLVTLVPELSARVWQPGGAVVLRAAEVAPLAAPVAAILRLWLEENDAWIERGRDEIWVEAGTPPRRLLEILDPVQHTARYGSVGLIDAFVRPHTALDLNTNPADKLLSDRIIRTTGRVKSATSLARLLSEGIIVLEPPLSTFTWAYVDASIEQGWFVECCLLSRIGNVTTSRPAADAPGHEDCAICRAPETAETPPTQWVEPRCGHAFHASCLLRWIFVGSPQLCCPLCRADLGAEK
jgi:hypothetical protein